MATGAYLLGSSEFRINSVLSGIQTDASVAALSSGGFIVTWTDASSDGSGTGIRAQRYDANGVAVGSEFQVNSSTLNAQDSSAVTAMASGGFIVTWTDNSGQGGDADKTSVKAQMYAADGSRVGGGRRCGWQVHVAGFVAQGGSPFGVVALRIDSVRMTCIW